MSESATTVSTIAAWRILLRGFGIILALGVFCYWFAAGQNTGWTKDKIEVHQIDEITGIEYITYQNHFLPGIEFLVIGIGFGLCLSTITFIPYTYKSSK